MRPPRRERRGAVKQNLVMVVANGGYLGEHSVEALEVHVVESLSRIKPQAASAARMPMLR